MMTRKEAPHKDDRVSPVLQKSKMKILFLGVFKPTSTNWRQSKALALLGHDVVCFNYRDWSVDIAVSKAREKLALEHFDLVLYAKCNNFPFLNNDGKSFLWYPDPMHNINSELIEKVKKANVVGCALWEPYEYLLKFNSNTYFIPEGFDATVFKPFNTKKDINVSFIGNMYGQRRHLVNKVGATVFNNVFNEKHNEIVGRSKINLNFTKGGCSDRVYKILAARGFLLTQPWPHMTDLFTPDKDFAIFDNEEDMVYKIKYYIANVYERRKIAQRGYETVRQYTVMNWAKKVLEIIK